MKRILICFAINLVVLLPAMAQKAIEVNNTDVNTDKPLKELYIPNAFTPNGDGLNDYFKILNITTEKIIDFRVFNRWGTIMYRSGGDNHAAWDGKYKEKLQPTGVYGYLMKIGYPDGQIATYKGTITLLN